MATSLITGTIQDASGTALANVQVTAVLRPRPAFVTATGAELPAILATTTDSSGNYSLTLTRTADITPSGSYYEIVERIPAQEGGPVQHVIQVGSSPATVYASLVSSPPATSTSVFLTQAAGDARYVQSPGSFATVGSITDSRPADAGAAGVLTTYARGDHKHSREIVRSTAAIISALSGADLITGHPYVTSDANAITGTGIARADTTSQPARTDSLYVRNARRFQPGYWNQPWGVMGLAQATASQSGVTTVVDATSLTITFTAAANRRYKITAQALLESTVAGDFIRLSLTDSVNTLLNLAQIRSGLANNAETASTTHFITPAAGSVTYKLRLERLSGTGTVSITAGSTFPAQLVIEDIGPNGAPA